MNELDIYLQQMTFVIVIHSRGVQTLFCPFVGSWVPSSLGLSIVLNLAGSPLSSVLSVPREVSRSFKEGGEVTTKRCESTKLAHLKTIPELNFFEFFSDDELLRNSVRMKKKS